MSPPTARRLRRSLSGRLHFPPRLAWRVAQLLLAGSLGGCACGCNDDCKRVASVEIVPLEVLTTSNVSFALQAIARNSDGFPIAAPLPFKWSGDIAFENSKANPAVVTASAAGVYWADVSVGKVKSAKKAAIHVTAEVESPAGDMLILEHQSGWPPADVLIDARATGDGADCGAANDRQFSVVAAAVLPKNLIDGCGTEVAIFPFRRAPLVEVLDAEEQWTAGVDRLRRPTLPDTIPIDITVWYFVEDVDPTPIAKAHLDHANWVLRTNRTGLYIGTVRHEPQGVGLVYTPHGSCANIEGELGFTATMDRLHIVYVPTITDAAGTTGYACTSVADRGAVIVLSYADVELSTPAHEIGHHLGLSNPPFPFSTSGHVKTYTGFHASNLMWNYEPLGSEDGRVHLTLGQLYRMHAEQESLLNRHLPAPRKTGLSKTCHDTDAAAECPQLRQDRTGS